MEVSFFIEQSILVLECDSGVSAVLLTALFPLPPSPHTPHPTPPHPQAAVDNSPISEQALVIAELVQYNDLPAAARLAHYCHLPDTHIPATLQLYMEGNTHV